MKSKSPRFNVVAATAAVVLCAAMLASMTGARAQEPEGNYGVGIPGVFLPKYLLYRSAQLASATPQVMRIKLGYVKGLSRSFTNMVGEMAVDLESGGWQASLSGLTPGVTYSVWLVDRPEIDGLPDTAFNLATILAVGPSTLLSGVLGVGLPVGFTIDRAVVAEGAAWGGPPLGAGTVNVFQKIFFRRLSLLNGSTGATVFAETTPPPRLFALVPDLAAETDALGPLAGVPTLGPSLLGVVTLFAQGGGGSGSSVNLDKLISQGAKLFFEETFQGNGRTCGTCHPASNNFTIDPEFISHLPANDPLFVAEFNPTLAQLERPVLMRQFGLILENLDGFSDPTNKFVMRGVPHTLGLQVTLEQDTSLVPAPAEMTGWSGDGAPGTGSLREFAIGAVTQHFTRTLNRVAGTDFKLPKEHQLDAMEAFQLSLGRDKDFDLSKLTFNDANVDSGKNLFVNGNGGGTCAFCHTNGGARSAALQNQNRNFNTNVEDKVHPARGVLDFPKDGGFGRTDNLDGTFGNHTFNTAPVAEAADTAPFFHNNVVTTLEGVLDFYTGPEFNTQRPPAARFNFDQTQREQIVDFMRSLNTLQNIDVATRELGEILANQNDPRQEQDRRLQTAFEDTQDGIDVLTEGGIYPTAVTRLTEARNLISQALFSGDGGQRRTLIQQAIAKLAEARTIIATVIP